MRAVRRQSVRWQRLLVLDQMAERVADGPRTADELAHRLLAAQPFEAAGVIGGETVIVPADGPAHLHVVGVDAAGRVMRRRDAARDPVRSRPARRAVRRDGPQCWPAPGLPAASGSVRRRRPRVHRSVGRRTSASVLPSRSKARHLTAPVLKSQPVTIRSAGTQRSGSATCVSPDE